VYADITKSSVPRIFVHRVRASTFSHAYTHARTRIPDCVCNRFLAGVARPSSVKIHTALLNAARTFAQNNARVNLYLLSMHLDAKHQQRSNRECRTCTHRRTHNRKRGRKKGKNGPASRGFLRSRGRISAHVGHESLLRGIFRASLKQIELLRSWGENRQSESGGTVRYGILSYALPVRRHGAKGRNSAKLSFSLRAGNIRELAG